MRETLRGGRFYELLKAVYFELLFLKRSVTGTNRRIRKQYLETHAVRKLQIGAGKNIKDGWLNSDLCPMSGKVLYLNARRRFPFADDTFDYVYCEHVIEHMAFPDGMRMLAECRRILKPGGSVRISTPNLQFLVDLCGHRKSGLQERYLRWAVKTYVPEALSADAAFVVNMFMRNWDHRFIYDERTLRLALEHVGFQDIREWPIQQSGDGHLRNLENVERMQPEFLALESMILEARKPSGTPAAFEARPS